MVRATSVGSGSVRDRVIVVKLASRSLITTVRATAPAERRPRAVRPDRRSSSRRITSGSSTSLANVSSAPMLFSGVLLTTGRSSRPQASAARWAPSEGPSSRCRVPAGISAMSRTVRRPSRASTCPVCSPTPHSAATGSGCRKSRTPSGGTTSSPSGLERVDASLAMNLDGATPTEQVMPCCSAIVARISAPIRAGRPSRRMAPDTSRNASSSASGSTSGVTDRKTSMTSLDTAA